MKLQKWGLVALGFALTLVGASAASADTVRVDRDGRTYNISACARGNPAFTARCHAHIVTDIRGTPILGHHG